ncbi:methyltransferase domain-containing protein [Streptomyces sp. ACT015]|uniref:methyltransferase domain-containing protein n=1 Tax=Streptomyces sp. ACT015 TaxID=3134807 RepID=UPI003D179217
MTRLHDAELAAAFDRAAHGYDTLVAANPGYHAHLRRSARRLGLGRSPEGLRVLDLGCGTGASTAALAAVLPGAEITAVDASAGMLERARAKRWPARVTFVHASAEDLTGAGAGAGSGGDGRTGAGSGNGGQGGTGGPDEGGTGAGTATGTGTATGAGIATGTGAGTATGIGTGAGTGIGAGAGVSGPFDAVFAAYLFRNVTDPDAVLARVHGLLAPGGRLAAHEYTLSGRWAHRALWTAVSRGLVLPVATALGDGPLYRHLWRSVVEFDTAAAFTDRVRAAGFDRVRALPLPGWQTGITHTVVARRADRPAGPR